MDADVTIAAAFGAGILSFASPCVLPLVPPYLSYITGATLDEIGARAGWRSRLPVLGVAIAFILGFSTVFVGLGATASVFGQLLHRWSETLAIVAGAMIIVMGLHFLGLFRLSALYREARFQSGGVKAGPVGSYVMGLAFAFGWTPCIGPVLATILAVAGSREGVGEGAWLLAVYSAGLGLPFLAAAAFAARFVSFLGRFKAHFRKVEMAMGAILVLTGIAFLSGGMQRLSFWLIDAFPGLATIG